MNATQIKDAVIAAPEYYNNHYINIDENKNVIAGWSDGPHNNRTPTDKDILINDKGGYQFRLIIDGKETKENPPLFDGMTMIPLYKWTGFEVAHRTEDEIDADLASYKEKQERQSRLAQLHKKLESTDYIAAKIAEGVATKEEYSDMLRKRQAWRDEINELEWNS